MMSETTYIGDTKWMQVPEPIDTRRITLEMFSEGVDINYKDGYVEGIRFAEKMHGIGVDDE
jgi:hypothetical protein